MNRKLTSCLVAAVLLGSYSTSIVAGASLPSQKLNLLILDLNGAPFRQFHLRHFSGSVVDHRLFTLASSAAPDPLGLHQAMRQTLENIGPDALRLLDAELATQAARVQLHTDDLLTSPDPAAF